MQPIRTNNDIEGWHNVLNRRASDRSSLPFYLLIQLLNREARQVEVQMRLVADHKLTRIQRRKYRVLQTKLHEQWEQYQSRKKTAFEVFLKTVWANPHTVNSCVNAAKLTQKNFPCILNKTY